MVVDVDRPDEAVAVTDMKVFAPNDVVPAGRLVSDVRAAGVEHGGSGSTVQSDLRARRSRDNIIILFVDCCALVGCGFGSPRLLAHRFIAAFEIGGGLVERRPKSLRGSPFFKINILCRVLYDGAHRRAP